MKPPHADPLHQRVRAPIMQMSTVLLGVISVALALGAVGQAAGPAVSFAPPLDYEINVSGDVATADLNGDRKLDLVATNDEGSSVYVLLNRGRGKFSRRAYRTGAGPGDIAIADLNADGEPDLVIASKTVSVLLNAGDGTFAARSDYVPTGSIAIDDMNGDGKPDLVIANSDSISLLFNAGDGTFGDRLGYESTGPSPSSLAVADLNGDGKPDLAITDEEVDTLSVLLNNGAADFERHVYATDEQAAAVAIADVNGDSKPDLLTANESGETVSVFTNDGDGALGGRRDYPVGPSPISIAIADLNGDRAPDVATANWDGITVSVLTNRGNGTFRPRRNFEAGDNPSGLAAGDLNGDRRPDLATTTGYDISTLSVLRNMTGLCAVPNLKGKRLAAATKATLRAGCSIGTVARAYSQKFNKGRVVSQSPRFGAVRPGGSKVSLVVSKGRRK